jgi:hypothetical protein
MRAAFDRKGKFGHALRAFGQQAIVPIRTFASI